MVKYVMRILVSIVFRGMILFMILSLFLFRGKKVILVDDVITRGRTFVQIANKLISNGASSVEGLFVAKTINPNWNTMVA